MLGDLSQPEIHALLTRQHVGHLGVFGDGRVFVFPVSYGYDGTSIYLQSHDGLKVRLMRGHPEVCFEVEDIVGPGRWRTVLCHGTFQEVTRAEDRDRAFAVIASQGDALAPDSIAPYVDGPDSIIVYRIRVTELQGRFERNDPIVLNRAIHAIG